MKIDNVDIIRRTDEVRLILEDIESSGVKYIGRASFHDAQTNQPRWQIQRISRQGDIITKEFAEYGKYNQIWDDRATLFLAIPPGNLQPLPEFEDGLRADGYEYQKITIDSVSWTPLVVTSGVTGFVSMSIQNVSNREVRLRHDNIVAFEGMRLDTDEERAYNDIQSGFEIYARCDAGTVDLNVEFLTIA